MTLDRVDPKSLKVLDPNISEHDLRGKPAAISPHLAPGIDLASRLTRIAHRLQVDRAQALGLVTRPLHPKGFPVHDAK
jgi:hypothetical protein